MILFFQKLWDRGCWSLSVFFFFFLFSFYKDYEKACYSPSHESWKHSRSKACLDQQSGKDVFIRILFVILCVSLRKFREIFLSQLWHLDTNILICKTNCRQRTKKEYIADATTEKILFSIIPCKTYPEYVLPHFRNNIKFQWYFLCVQKNI